LAEYLNKSECRSMRRGKTGDPSVVVAYVRVSTDEQKIGPRRSAQRSSRGLGRPECGSSLGTKTSE
jgi:hypothetical protein